MKEILHIIGDTRIREFANIAITDYYYIYSTILANTNSRSDNKILLKTLMIRLHYELSSNIRMPDYSIPFSVQ